MTLAVMTRASLGHTGHALVASAATTAICASIVGAALARVAHGIAPFAADLHHLAAGLWILAFAGFAFRVLPAPDQAAPARISGRLSETPAAEPLRCRTLLQRKSRPAAAARFPFIKAYGTVLTAAV